jgi:hypothetical protein
VPSGPLYSIAFWIQLTFYILGLAGCWPAVATRSRLATGVASFLVLNTAAWVAFWVWAFGRSSHSWAKVRYQIPVPSQSANS